MAQPGLNGHASNEPMSISSRTHQVKKPFSATDAIDACDFDFTGCIVRGLASEELGDVARLSLQNVFQQVNTFPGIRFIPILVIEDTTLLPTNSIIVVDASVLDQDITITLPPTLATGQTYWVIRIDETEHVVQVVVDDPGTEVMNAAETFKLIEYLKTVVMMDAAVGFWKVDDFVNTSFPNLRLGRKVVDSDYDVQPNDAVIFVQGATGTVNINLPFANPPEGFTRYLHVAKLDDNDEIVAVNAAGDDTIEGSISFNLGERYANVSLFESGPGTWAVIGFEPDDEAGGTVPDFGDNFRIRDLDPIHGVAFEVRDIDDVTWKEQVRYTEPGSGPAPVAEVAYWYRPEIVDDAGVAAWPTAGYLENSRLDVIYPTGLRAFIIKPGAAGVGDIAPDDYDAGTNDVHWQSIM